MHAISWSQCAKHVMVTWQSHDHIVPGMWWSHDSHMITLFLTCDGHMIVTWSQCASHTGHWLLNISVILFLTLHPDQVTNQLALAGLAEFVLHFTRLDPDMFHLARDSGSVTQSYFTFDVDSSGRLLVRVSRGTVFPCTVTRWAVQHV